ncbi:MAG: trypsin-like peptidase domain-containing protein [Myxococcota bacterium]
MSRPLIALVLAGCAADPLAVIPEEAPASALSAQPAEPPKVTVTPRDVTLLGLADALPEVAERSVASVVSVSTRRAARFSARGPAPEGLGSGVIVRGDGIVVTNNHVIEGATSVTVTLPDGSDHRADVVGSDPSSDLAVLRIVNPPGELPALPFGDSAALRLGEVVLAVGNPFGIGQTVTMGIVSAKGRSNVGIVRYEDFIQTDAAINPGNSGGALVDLEGSLVGINTAIFSRSGGSQGIGFSIPASMAADIVDDILTDGTVDRGWLGVMIGEVDPSRADSLGITGGVRIDGVQPGTPAADAGLSADDIVVAFQGEPVRDVNRFRNRVAQTGSGKPFTLQVIRGRQARTIEGTLGALPQ